MPETGSERTAFSLFYRESVTSIIEWAFHSGAAPVLVRLITFFGIVCMATGALVCSHGPPPFQLDGKIFHYSIPGKMMMFTGALLSMTGLVAVIEARNLSRIATFSLIHCLCGVLVLETAAGSLGIAFSLSVSRGFLNTSLSEDLREAFFLSPKVTLYWNHLQKNLRCCGVVGPEDWWESQFRHRVSHLNVSQPASCCAHGRVFCNADHVYKEGCGEVSSRILYDSFVRLYICAFVCVLVHTSSYLVLFFLQGKV